MFKNRFYIVDIGRKTLHNNCMFSGGRFKIKDFAKISAFTLAEVLIVIGIIGMIADLTLPNLIKDFEK
ncbi:MAG TPA: hypothetical protein PLG15_04825 [Candidatus Gastranaerophilaceae bacterium]|nr:hypothetical protein [Candidatus Gastranaerophilaceae bacterium]HPT41687.1 hypothetical protein [Candidatus Gastranaerophilaceae bacterium]